MTRATESIDMGTPPTSPNIKEWADLDTPTDAWQPETIGFQGKISAIKTYLIPPENRALVAVALRYIVAYTIIPMVGTHITLLMFRGVEMWQDLILLATFAPIIIAVPIAAHGVSIRFKAIQLNAKYKQLLDHDDLTGLNSRRYMFKQLENQSSQFNYIFMVDMDRLKYINDQMGHLAGDAALIRIAGALSASAKVGDAVGRLSGDEFMVLTTTDNADDVLMMAQRIIEKLQQKNQGYNKAQAITVSIGIAKMEHGTSICKTVHEADKALYYAKQKGGNCVQFADLSKDMSPPPAIWPHDQV